jgi:hypothetical protein
MMYRRTEELLQSFGMQISTNEHALQLLFGFTFGV